MAQRKLPHDRLSLLADNYRRARHRATRVRAERARIELDGRYHLDGFMPRPLSDHASMHEEKQAALALADSIVRWLDGHE
jgi:hypothetical protein